ncbi:sugar phosphate isomerase/epimerase family protein [Aquirufa sp.]|jgi:2-keto-myo-inositol isomerase|uniref:sugar phosphate isomerase/epimerase family protein n=1 Tax=Aquirufa sp. TaxID=2676249 RepID=UPI0037C103D9
MFDSYRRDLLKAAALVPFSTSASASVSAARAVKPELSLNMSTIMGQKLGFIRELEVCAQAGFRSCEIWMPTLEAYLKSGGTISDARKRLSDLGLRIQNAIGFAQWIVDDATVRLAGVEQLKREMDLLAQLGCMRTAAPPMGATKEAGLDLHQAAERYRVILELGVKMGVTPQLEMWGHSKNLNRVADILFVAAEAGHPSARLLLDVFHIYKGGSSVDCLHTVGQDAVEIFHVNDYMTSLVPDQITDADRIYVGDGEAPIRKILNLLKPEVISLELFNKELYKQDPLTVAKIGFDKMAKLVT